METKEQHMGQLWDIVQSYRAKFDPHPPSNRRLAMQLGMSPTALANWEGELSRLPERGNLIALADLSGVPYLRVLDAALTDARFLPEIAARTEHERAKAKVREDNQAIWLFIKETLGKTGAEMLAMTAEERTEAAAKFLARKDADPHESWLMTNARMTMLGHGLNLKWLIADFGEFPEDELAGHRRGGPRSPIEPAAFEETGVLDTLQGVANTGEVEGDEEPD